MSKSELNKAKRDLLLEAAQRLISDNNQQHHFRGRCSSSSSTNNAERCCKAAASLDISLEIEERHDDTVSALIHAVEANDSRERINAECTSLIRRQQRRMKSGTVDKVYIAAEDYLAHTDELAEVSERLSELTSTTAAIPAPDKVFGARAERADRFMAEILARKSANEDTTLIATLPDVPSDNLM